VTIFADLRRYVEHDGWAEEPNLVRGGARTGDHRRYRKDCADGTVLRTKVSHSLRDEIGIDLFRHILRGQLCVTEEQFWAVVRGDTASSQPRRPQAPTLPGWLVERLIDNLGLGEDEIRTMTPGEALAVWDRYRARPR